MLPWRAPVRWLIRWRPIGWPLVLDVARKYLSRSSLQSGAAGVAILLCLLLIVGDGLRLWDDDSEVLRGVVIGLAGLLAVLLVLWRALTPQNRFAPPVPPDVSPLETDTRHTAASNHPHDS